MIEVLGNRGSADLLGVAPSQTSRWKDGVELPGPDMSTSLVDLDHVLGRLLLVWDGKAAYTEGSPGHPLYIHPVQGRGQWDNPDRYLLRYVATSPEAAIGESFGNLARWTPDMLTVPLLPGAERQLATYSIDETQHPLLDFDDANTLVERAMRPTQVMDGRGSES